MKGPFSSRLRNIAANEHWRHMITIRAQVHTKEHSDLAKPTGTNDLSPRVLIAEDHGPMRDLLSMLFRSHGFEVIQATSGMALIDLLAEHLLGGSELEPADLLVTDYRMPGVDGLEVLRGIQELGWKMPIILTTAFGSRAIHEEATALGAAAVFDKPFDLDELAKTAIELLRRPGASSPEDFVRK